MSAPVGNNFWTKRSSHGRRMLFNDSEELWEACVQYFNWVEDHPIMTSETVKYRGDVSLVQVPKMRPMTLRGLRFFLNISRKTWRNYKGREGFFPIISEVEDIIWEQKFTGAAAGIFNANIIARDLDLRCRHIPGYGGPTVSLTNYTEADTSGRSALDAYLDLISNPFSDQQQNTNR